MNGNQRRPIRTGITPTYIPIIAKYDACSTFGVGAKAAASTLLLNRVPSEIVIPTSYGTPAIQERVL